MTMSCDKSVMIVIFIGCWMVSSVSLSQLIPPPNRDACTGALCMDPGCDLNDRYLPPGECCEVCPKPTVPDCIFVDCIIPNCEDTYFSKLECCPLCRTAGTCLYDGEEIPDGGKKRVDCNTCTCTNGSLACTEMACDTPCSHNGEVIQHGGQKNVECNTCLCDNGVLKCTEKDCSMKPGDCPPSDSLYVLLQFCPKSMNTCDTDNSCPGNKKCCKNKGCGQSCMSPLGTIETIPDGCFYTSNGRTIPNGRTIQKDRCNTCTCRNNQLECTKKSCPIEEKPGQCPPRPNTIFTFCPSTCLVDSGCPGNKKCCDMGCGKSCEDPVTDQCRNVVCPFLRCTRRYKPANKCCHVCEPL